MMRKFFKEQSGIAATEFALMAPILLLLLIGVIDYGMYMNAAMKLEDTAFATAQYIRAGGNEDDIEDNVLLESNLGLTSENANEVTVDVSYIYECDDGVSATSTTDCGTGDYLREYVLVTVSRTYETLIPYPGIYSSLDLSGSVRLQNN